jgi:hypothetical protein
MKASSHISVDLSRFSTISALESLSNLTKCVSKITSASVYTSCAGIGVHSEIGGTAGIQRIFELLAGMTNLRQVTVDLNRPQHFAGPGDVSLQALVVLLQAAKRLESLRLHQMDLVRTTNAMEDLVQLLPTLKKWRTLHVINCLGPVIGSFVNLVARHSHSMKVVRILATPLPPVALAELTARPQLKILQLHDLPNVTDFEVVQVAMNLEHPQCILQELHLRSSILTDTAGQALTDMLFINKSLEKLYLHLDSEAVVQGMANCLATNTTLQRVDLRCYGDDGTVSQNVMQMALALRCNQTLSKLRLCLEVEPHDHQTDIVKAFQETLQHHNTSLRQVRLDDGIQKYDLPTEFELALNLNRSGFAQLAASPQPNQVPMNQWITALTMSDADLSTTYTILHNCPMLFSAASATNEDLLEDSSSGSTTSKRRFRLPFRSRSNERSSYHLHYNGPSVVVVDETTNLSTKSHGRKQSGRTKFPSLRRKMMSLLAPSAERRFLPTCFAL